MISDKQRHEVAERLRELPSDTYDAIKEWVESGIFIEASIGDEADYSQIHNAILGCFPAEHMHPGDYEELHERLADLIDRPTCRICATDHEYEDSVRCDRCRMTFRRPWEPFKYCPNCGAEVVTTSD